MFQLSKRMVRPNKYSLSLIALLFLSSGLGASSLSDVATRTKALNDLLAEQWEYQLKDAPEFATAMGDGRYNDRLSDLSLAHVQQQKKDAQAFLKRFSAIDTSGFSEQDRLSAELMIRQLKDQITGIDLKLFEMPIDQFNGLHLLMAQLVAAIPFATTKDYENYLTRLNLVPQLFDTLIDVLKQGLKDKLLPPRFLLEEVVLQCASIAEPAGQANAFGMPVAKFPDGISAADQKRLRAAIITAVDTKVRPAYRKLQDFIAKDYAPHGRTEPGLWALPKGDALYRFAVEQNTTTKMTPAEIHQLGLKEVKRIEGEQAKIAKKLGYKDLKSMREALKSDPKVFATSPEQILGLYRKYIAQAEAKLPELFGLLPKAKVEVLPVEAFREKEAAGAEYHVGTPDGKRPGRVYVNTGDFAKRSLLDVETTAYHEGVPGHHMQLSIAQTLPGLPLFRQNASYTAYAEGWALYAEGLGKELRFYQDPLSYYGHLSDELLRACRLVLDTGVHYFHWTRAQMVDFFRAHSAEDEVSIQAETDRYIVYPGQALAYKIGQLKILELRERAKKQLGDKFSLRDFHDEILNGGALPLDALETRVDAWIAAQKARN